MVGHELGRAGGVCNVDGEGETILQSAERGPVS